MYIDGYGRKKERAHEGALHGHDISVFIPPCRPIRQTEGTGRAEEAP